jgi:hypothetical protein
MTCEVVRYLRWNNRATFLVSVLEPLQTGIQELEVTLACLGVDVKTTGPRLLGLVVETAYAGRWHP